MARSSGQQRFQKRQREEARREKAQAKAARKQERRESDDSPSDEEALLEEFRALSEQHAAGKVGEADFEQRRREIMDELGVESD